MCDAPCVGMRQHVPHQTLRAQLMLDELFHSLLESREEQLTRLKRTHSSH